MAAQIRNFLAEKYGGQEMSRVRPLTLCQMNSLGPPCCDATTGLLAAQPSRALMLNGSLRVDVGVGRIWKRVGRGSEDGTARAAGDRYQMRASVNTKRCESVVVGVNVHLP